MDCAKYNIAYFKDARVIFAAGDRNTVKGTYAAAVSGARLALRRFGVKPVFPLMNIFITPRRRDYDRLVAHLTRVPTHNWRLGQPQGHDLYLISPKAYPKDISANYLNSSGTCDMAMYKRFIAHEMVHMMEEYVSPKGAMEVRPQWWSDGLAVYLTGQYRDRVSSKHIKADLAAGRLPSIDGMKGAPAYTWGWSLVRHIERRFGRKKFRSVLLESNTSDIPGFLKISRKALEKDWQSCVWRENGGARRP